MGPVDRAGDVERPPLPPRPFLYPLTADSGTAMGPEAQVRELLAGGARIVQLRSKTLDDRRRLAACLAARREARARRSLLIVNDRVDIALAAGAHGVHVGDRDLPPERIRRLPGGPGLLVGISTHSVDEALRAAESDVDYVAIGPIFPSSTKSQRGPLGLECLARLRSRTAVPLVAIGGISMARIRSVVEAGADGIAVVSAVTTGGDLRSSARTGVFSAARAAGRGEAVYLIGFMAAGKSTLGRLLASALDRPFIDLDQEIEVGAGQSVAALWKARGEAGFRTLEAEALKAVAGRRAVIAVGGGAPLREDNRRLMLGTGLVLGLDVPVEVLWERGRGAAALRPLWADQDAIRRVFDGRVGVYDFAHAKVELGRMDPETSMARLLALVGEWERVA